MGRVPDIADIDAAWVASHVGVAEPTSLQRSPVGSGQVANCYRMELTSSDGSVVRSIAKTPSNDATSRSTAALQHLYFRETSFYQHLANEIDTRTPRCFFADRDEDDNFLLLLEDMSPAAQVDQFDGLSIEQAKTGLYELAGLHGPTLGDTALHSADWLGGATESLRPLYAAVLPALFDQFLDRYNASIDDPLRTFVSRLGNELSLFSGYEAPFAAVTHGDFRTDNLIFEGASGQVPLAGVDWQTIGVGSPLLDVAYFITTSLTPEDCESNEQDLLSYYLNCLSDYDVDYPQQLAMYEFARYTLQPVVMLVAAAVIVEQTPRGDEMFLTMIRRGAQASNRWNAFRELERHAATQ